MSEKTKLGQRKKINRFTYQLNYSFDLTHGRGWFARIIDDKHRIFDAFDKKSKFKAVRSAEAKRKEFYNL